MVSAISFIVEETLKTSVYISGITTINECAQLHAFGLAALPELQLRFKAKAFSPLRYSIHLWDLKHPGTWESKGTYVYYTDFAMELAMLFLDLMHHIHMLVRHIVLRIV